MCQNFRGKRCRYFEVRSLNNKNCYNRNSQMDSSMGRPIPLTNIEQDQKFDDALVERLATVLKVLSNLED